MKRKTLLIFLVPVLLVALFVGASKIPIKDITGCYTQGNGSTLDRICLNKDGTFEQFQEVGGASISFNKGTWRIYSGVSGSESFIGGVLYNFRINTNEAAVAELDITPVRNIFGKIYFEVASERAEDIYYRHY